MTAPPRARSVSRVTGGRPQRTEDDRVLLARIRAGDDMALGVGYDAHAVFL